MNARAPAALEGGGQPHGGALLAAQLRDARRLGLEDDDRLRPEIGEQIILNNICAKAAFMCTDPKKRKNTDSLTVPVLT